MMFSCFIDLRIAISLKEVIGKSLPSVNFSFLIATIS